MSETKLTVLVTKDLRQKVKAAAAMRGETISNVVRSALVEYLEKRVQPEYDTRSVSGADALKNDPLLSLRFRGGPGDVAEQVEEILIEASDPIYGFRLDNDHTA